jgi:hypothetical protein
MPQIQLPIFPSQSTAITSELAFQEREGTVWYFNGHLPVFSHRIDDKGSFRFFSSQLIANGTASQSEISRAFGVPIVSVKRGCKKLREEGAGGFFREAVPHRGHKLTPERLEALLDEMAAGKVPVPGPQNGRYAAEPLSGLTSLKDHAGIILINNCQPTQETLEKAEAEKIPIMVSDLPAFEISGKVYNILAAKS